MMKDCSTLLLPSFPKFSTSVIVDQYDAGEEDKDDTVADRSVAEQHTVAATLAEHGVYNTHRDYRNLDQAGRLQIL